jgi:ABC-2 type transport system ATP-binding protein
MAAIVQVERLKKTYGPLVAVDGVSFTIQEGEIFGLIGPNGAGKTTIIECLEGLRNPDGGTLRVLGLEPTGNVYSLRQRVGIQLQEAALPARLKVEEVCRLFSSFYDHPVPWEPLVGQVGLSAKRQVYVGTLSGGQKQRLFIVLALLNNPDLIFLDELTTGLDPQARHVMWDLVKGFRETGKTVLLTTHFMEEAEHLCDRVAIIDHGKLIALDSPQNLVRSLKGYIRVRIEMEGDFSLSKLKEIEGVTTVERNNLVITLEGKGDRLVSQIVNVLEEEHILFRNLRTEQPNLEDVFLRLTGHAIRE